MIQILVWCIDPENKHRKFHVKSFLSEEFTEQFLTPLKKDHHKLYYNVLNLRDDFSFTEAALKELVVKMYNHYNSIWEINFATTTK